MTALCTSPQLFTGGRHEHLASYEPSTHHNLATSALHLRSPLPKYFNSPHNLRRRPSALLELDRQTVTPRACHSSLYSVFISKPYQPFLEFCYTKHREQDEPKEQVSEVFRHFRNTASTSSRWRPHLASELRFHLSTSPLRWLARHLRRQSSLKYTQPAFSPRQL